VGQGAIVTTSYVPNEKDACWASPFLGGTTRNVTPDFLRPIKLLKTLRNI